MHLLWCIFVSVIVTVESSEYCLTYFSEVEYRCEDGKCIPQSKICDGKSDCPKGEDELICSKCWIKSFWGSDAYLGFRCSDGKCLEMSQKCDGTLDCKKGEDESECKGELTMEIDPPEQDVYEDERVEISCKSNGGPNYSMIWSRLAGREMPEMHVSQFRGHLKIEKMKRKFAGTYICTAYNGTRFTNFQKHATLRFKGTKTKTLAPEMLPQAAPLALDFIPTTQHFPTNLNRKGKVICVPQPQITSTTTTTTTTTSKPPIDCYFQCADGSFVAYDKVCNQENDCRDGSDEYGCSRSPKPPITTTPAPPTTTTTTTAITTTTTPPPLTCNTNEFQCGNSRCIPYSALCDKQDDCGDESDELPNVCHGPRKPYITKLPKFKTEVTCNSGVQVSLNCEAIGNPTPKIYWKRSEGALPAKCYFWTKGGVGSLICPKFESFDQGEYSCIAENIHKISESYPRSIVKCSNTAQCEDNEFEVILPKHEIHFCLDCFCSGRSSKCVGLNSRSQSIDIPRPVTRTKIYISRNGFVKYIPSNNGPTPPSLEEPEFQHVTYCSVPETFLRERTLTKSYGRNIVIKKFEEKVNFIEKAPDVIMRGNGVTLTYYFKKVNTLMKEVKIRFWPGHWLHLDQSEANRFTLMLALAKVDLLLFRCEYEEGKILSSSEYSEIELESGVIDNADNSSSFLEKCECPQGYSGLSCDVCATDYEREDASSGTLGNCIPSIQQCPEGYINPPDCKVCDEANGYRLSPIFPNKCTKSNCNENGTMESSEFSNKCICKEGVKGEFCDQCKDGYYHLHPNNKLGCIPCWCSGVSKECESSKLFRNAITGEVHGGQNSTDGKSLWLLPTQFSGQLLSSYGGYLKYTLLYKPNIKKQQEKLTIKILSQSDVMLTHTIPELDETIQEDSKSFQVRIEEDFWRESLTSHVVERGELLKVLTKVKAIYIESPYPFSYKLVNLTDVRLDNAQLDKTGHGLAHEVEECKCPEGYKGRSCESCSELYYKDKSTNRCIKCECENCDPVDGCLSCKKNEYVAGYDIFGKSICKLCPCNGNEKSCELDDNGILSCFCKPGFQGEHCESPIQDGSQLKVTISPNKVKNKEMGVNVLFNCSYDSTEEMKIVFIKKYKSGKEIDVPGDDPIEEMSKTNKFGTIKILNVKLEMDLLQVDCHVYNMDNMMVGFVMAIIEDTGEIPRPPTISNCESTVIVKEKESIELICEATGEPKPELQWYEKVLGSWKSINTIQGVHQIQDASLSQNGTAFRCTAVNGDGEDKCSTMLIVKEICDEIVVTIEPEVIKAEEGQSFSLTCEATNNTEVHWVRKFNSLSINTSIYNGTLTIENASVGDSGEYICQTGNKKYSKTAIVEVERRRYGPTAQILQEDSILPEGIEFRIECNVTGYPEPEVSWNRIAGTLPYNSDLEENGKVLVLQYISKEDEGMYECQAKSLNGISKSRIAINILPKKIINVKKGSKLLIPCNTFGELKSTKKWFFEEEPVGIENLDQNGDFFVLKASIAHDGNYECSAQTTAGIERHLMEVIVEENLTPPYIKILPANEVTVLEGTNFNLECDVIEGEPHPTIEWLSNNLGIQEGKTLRFINITWAERGEYTCAAKNSEGTAITKVQVNVNVLPKVYVSPIEVHVEKGEKVTLYCEATGWPRPEIHWVKIKKQTTRKRSLQESSKLVEGMISNSEITFRSVDSSQEGEYVCTAENIVGKANESIKVFVHDFKQGTGETGYSYPAQLGTRYEIICPKTKGEIAWYKDGKPIRSECEATQNFVIASVQVQHKGRYECKSVANPEKSDHVTLSVTGFVPKFSIDEKSYLILPTTSNRTKGTRIQVSLRPEFPDGLIFLKENDLKFSLHLRKSKVYFNVLGNAMRIASEKELKMDVWSTITIEIDDKVTLTIEDEFGKTDRQEKILPENPTLNLKDGDQFYLGGSKFSYSQLRDKTSVHPASGHFKGCISRFSLNDVEHLIIEKAIFSKGVKLCQKCLENSNLCGEAENCFDAPTKLGFICACPLGSHQHTTSCSPSCVGKNCKATDHLDLCDLLDPCGKILKNKCKVVSSHLECDCSSQAYGVRCKKEVQHSFHLDGEGYAQLSGILLPRDKIGEEDIIEMKFTPSSLSGLLFWQGDDENYMSIKAESGEIIFSYENQGVKTYVSTDPDYDVDNDIHLVARRQNNTLYLQVGNHEYTKSTDVIHTNRVVGDIYIGGSPKESAEGNGFRGSILSVKLGNKPEINFSSKEVTLHNAKKIEKKDDEYDFSDKKDSEENNIEDE